MVVMMVVRVDFERGGRAFHVRAFLVLALKLKRCVGYAVFKQFFLHRTLYGGAVALAYNDVHRRAVVYAVEASHVDVMHAHNAVDGKYVLRKLF
jgi:hypothetical protein